MTALERFYAWEAEAEALVPALSAYLDELNQALSVGAPSMLDLSRELSQVKTALELLL